MQIYSVSAVVLTKSHVNNMIWFLEQPRQSIETVSPWSQVKNQTASLMFPVRAIFVWVSILRCGLQSPEMELQQYLLCKESKESAPLSKKQWVDWGGKSFGVSPLCLCQIWSYSCYLLNVKGLIVFKDGAASADARPCAGLFFKTVWCLSTPGATSKLCQDLNNQRLLRELLLPELFFIVRIWSPSRYSKASVLADRTADAGTGAAACHAGIAARLRAPQ